MKRLTKILKNSIRCNKCGEILVSKHTHDFVPCKCFRDSDGKEGVACDGGTSYLRRLGDLDGYEEMSVTRLYTDEERDEYNAQKELMAEQFGYTDIEYME